MSARKKAAQVMGQLVVEATELLTVPKPPPPPPRPLTPLERLQRDPEGAKLAIRVATATWKAMPKRYDTHEEWAIALLQQMVDLDRKNRDALPGSVVRLIKQAQTILKKRRKPLPKTP